MPDFNQQIIAEFRATGGRVGGWLADSRLLLLTTTGARSGAPHTVPVGYLPDGERQLVIGSAGGSSRHPAWFHNLVAHPRATVEDGIFTYEVTATVLTGAERDAVFARAVEADPGWGAYEETSGRTLPVVALERVPGPPVPPGTPFGTGLRMIHDAFRRELELIRAEVARAEGPTLGAQLRVNCLTLCQGLEFHHTMEDRGMFPAVAAQRPDLADVMARLRREHEVVAALLADLQAAVSRDDPDRAAVRRDVERLTAQVEAHLAYEEEHLVPVLNG
ncbi:nitroreductase/quinone reductase family protein [Spirilliplanes yamanashiensis]|uniref:Cation-binding protein n=1 Tax=Spirilliplanes yamanashiensis TaxID=42233 RepID=A0A8J4DGB7_9ACTN|nr:nitroreductase/quinone reductase family protein [Spirilliplanes yamanashiensis]MDP9820134.1 deazaflavin-dependent oxidoreductase (nitroreductase family) [Spirilliplanes yamanashiensis]GIJ01046.1 cation-binding protein [Spirilliplanes yamanashiensis]